MFKNIVFATLLFAAIAALGWVTLRPVAPPPAAQTAAPPPALDTPLTLSPASDFTPRQKLPSLTLQTALPSVAVRLYHIQDTALTLRLYRGISQDSLSEVALARLLAETTSPLATYNAPLVNGRLTFDWRTPLSLGDAPGLYVLTLAKDLSAPPVAARWFLRSNLLVAAVEDQESWHVLCQQLPQGTAAALNLHWYGQTATAPLSRQSCDTKGQARLDKASLPEKTLPQFLVAQASNGDNAFVPLSATRLPVASSPARTPYFFTDRQHFVPGQNIHAWAVGFTDTDASLPIRLIRPDGLTIAETILPAPQAMAVPLSFTLPAKAMPGAWQIFTQRKDGTRLSLSLQVGTPPTPAQSRLKLVSRTGDKLTLTGSWQSATGEVQRDQPAQITLRWEAERSFPALAADYAFGGYENPDSAPQRLAGLVLVPGANFTVTLPAAPSSNTPLRAVLRLEAVDGTPLQAHPLEIPVPTEPWALGIKPEPVPESRRNQEQARFRVGLWRNDSNTAAAAPPPTLSYELVTERRSYRWFFADGKWDYKTAVVAVPVRAGTVPLDEKRQGTITVPIQQGNFRLDVFTADRSLTSSWRFQNAAPAPTAALRWPLSVTRKNQDQAEKLALPALPKPAMLLQIDDALRHSEPSLGGVPTTMIDALPQGGTVLVLGAETDGSGAWQFAQGAAWVPPASLAQQLQPTITLPPALNAGTTAMITVRLPMPQAAAHFVQLVARPEMSAAQPFGLPPLPQTVPVNITTNLGAWQPPRFTEEPIPPAHSAVTQVSAVMPVPADGHMTVPLPLPVTGGKYQLHILIWNKAAIGSIALPLTIAESAPVAATEAPPASAALRLRVSQEWACHAPLAEKQSLTLPPMPADKTATLLLGALAVPQNPVYLQERLLAAETNRSDVLARGLLPFAAYQDLLGAQGIPAEQAADWQEKVATILLARQRGDGGISLYEQGASDLTASAFTLRAWAQFPAALRNPTRERALQDYLLRRLDVTFGAAEELYPRSDAFFALSERGLVNPATLRYFIENFGNTIRHPVFEAELAVALASIQDNEQSRIFAERVMAQLPALRTTQPLAALHVLSLLAQHALVPADALVQAIPDNIPSPDSYPMLAVTTSAPLWLDIAQKLPEWRALWGGKSLAKSGLQLLPYSARTATTLYNTGTAPLVLCSDSPALFARPAAGKSAPLPAPTPAPAAMTTSLFSMNGQPISAAKLRRGQRYVMQVSMATLSAGPAELRLPLPPQIALRSIVPAGPLVGTLNWLGTVDGITAHQPIADGWLLSTARATGGDLRIALIIQAVDNGKGLWPAAQLAQFNGTYASTPHSYAIRE